MRLQLKVEIMLPPTSSLEIVKGVGGRPIGKCGEMGNIEIHIRKPKAVFWVGQFRHYVTRFQIHHPGMQAFLVWVNHKSVGIIDLRQRSPSQLNDGERFMTYKILMAVVAGL